MWQKALELADQTPKDRNRYVDLLRALSISAVVLGHWIMAAPSFDGSAQMQHLLDVQPWSRWLTWVFQVMPVFFFVGGFSNGVSWDSAQRKGLNYGEWLDARFRRLLGPAVPLVMVWLMLALVGQQFAVHPEFTRIGSQVALVPVWFLAIYFVIVAMVPITRKLWQKLGFWSVAVPVALAIAGDWVFFNTPFTWLGWFNYLFIWGAVHQMGYAWQQQRMPSALWCALIAFSGWALLVYLTHVGPYPLSLVGVPSEELSNTTPPKLPLLALAAGQIGLLILFEPMARRWLAQRKPWAATVLVNGLIMPVFLWHSTVMMLLIGAAFWLTPFFLSAVPGSEQWWLYRPAWVVVYFAVLMAALPLFLLSERIVSAGQRRPKHALITLVGAFLMCAGLALLAANGVAGRATTGINWVACLLPVAGLTLATLGSQRVNVNQSD